MTKSDATKYISYAVDDALCEHNPDDRPSNCRFVGWQCGFEPLFVAVWSYLGVRLGDEEAEELAADLLAEKHWFAGVIAPADYVI